MARAAAAAGIDGLMIEVHPDPQFALCDGAQALTPASYENLLAQVTAIHELVNARGFDPIAEHEAVAAV